MIRSLKYVAVLADQWVALLGWGAAALACAPRDRWMGWEPELRWQRLRFVANNQRFLILPGVRVKNLASRVLALNTRRLAADWQAVFGHPLLLVETFVDPQRFAGTSYLAAGWLRLGETRGYRRAGRRYHFHGQAKTVWVRALQRGAREACLSAQGRPARRGQGAAPPTEGRGGSAAAGPGSHRGEPALTAQLATLQDDTPLREVLAEFAAHRRDGRRVRALAPLGKNLALLQAIADPALGISGITNRALRAKLAGTPWANGKSDKALSARISRHLRLLRDHGIIRKLPRQHKYQLTDQGRRLTSVVSVLLGASTQKLLAIAA